jgi:hypothetical protein
MAMLPRALPFLIATLLLTPVGARGADEPSDAADTAEDEQLLKDARIDTDAPALLTFFRGRILTAEQLRKLDTLISRLADEDFKTREDATAGLKGFGSPALAKLREALQSKDAEVRLRTQEAITAIELRKDGPLCGAAARLLRVRRPAGAVPVLLDYLPFAADAEVEEDVLQALTVLGVRDGKVDPALVAALDDRAPARRAAAAMLVGWAGTEEQRVAVKALLADADPRVRLLAARGLLAACDRAVLPTLLALLKDAPLSVAEEAEALLARAAGDKAPTTPPGQFEAVRKKTHAVWETWLRTHGDGIDLAKADVSLPAFDSPARVREAAVRFALALYSRDNEGMKRTIAYPFYFPGAVRITRFEQLQEHLGDVRVDLAKLTITARRGKPVGVKDYTETATADRPVLPWLDDEKQFLSEYRPRDVRVVHLEITNSIPGDAIRTVLVRVSGGRPRAIGLGVGNRLMP